MAEQSLKDKTAKGLFWGGVSNGVQQLLGMLFGIYLARILNAEDYGLVGMLAIFTGIANTIINSGFTVALTNKQDVTHKDYNAVFWFSCFVGLLLYVVLFFSAPLIARFYNRSELISLSRVLFVGFCFSGIGTVAFTVMFKKLMVKEQAKIDITALVLSGLIGIVFALKGWAYWALVFQSVVYVSVSSVLKCVIAPWRPSLEFDFRPLRDMFSFSVKIFLTNIFQQINNNFFSVLLGRLFNATWVGYYSQGYKWMLMGNTILCGMVNSVAQPVLVQVREERQRQCYIFRKMVRFAVFLSFPCMIGLAFVAKEFILITIGEKWMPSVSFLQLFCLLGTILPIWLLYTQLLISYGKSNIYLLGNVSQGVIQLLLLYFTSPLGIETMIKAYISTYVVSLFYWHYQAYKLIGISLKDIVFDVFPYAVITALSLGSAWLLTAAIHSVYLLFIGRVLLMGSIYITLLWLANCAILKESLSFLRNKES